MNFTPDIASAAEPLDRAAETDPQLALDAAALASRIVELRTQIENLAKRPRAEVTAPGRGVELKPLCCQLAWAASECLVLLEEADLLPDEPFLGRLIEAKNELEERTFTIHYNRSARPAFETMWKMARTLDILGKDLLLCIGKPLHPWLGRYVSRVKRELGLAGCLRSEPIERGPYS